VTIKTSTHALFTEAVSQLSHLPLLTLE